MRDWFLDIYDAWKGERRWDMQQRKSEVRRLCPGLLDGINPNTPCRWKRSAARAAALNNKSILSPADLTRPTEYIMRVTDVLCLSHGPRLGARMARRSGTRCPSHRALEQTALAWHGIEPQEARQMREGSPQSCSAARQHAWTIHQTVLAHGQARCQRRTRDQHRRDVIPSLASEDDRVEPSRRQTSPAAKQHKRAHDIHSRLQHGSWHTGHVAADRARWQHRRRLGGTLAAAHVPRHIGEWLGNHDDAPAAHGHTGRRDEPNCRGESQTRERETESMFQGSVELRRVASRAADQDPHGSV